MANPNTMLLHGNLSLFSGQVRRFTVIVRSLFGEVLPGTRTNSESGGGVLNLRKVLTQAQKYDLQLRRVGPNALSSKPDNRSDGILLSNVPPVNEIMLWTVGYSRQLGGAGAGYRAQHYLIRSRLQAPPRRQFSAGRVRSHESPDLLKSPLHRYTGSVPNQVHLPVFSITYSVKCHNSPLNPDFLPSLPSSCLKVTFQ